MIQVALQGGEEVDLSDVQSVAGLGTEAREEARGKLQGLQVSFSQLFPRHFTVAVVQPSLSWPTTHDVAFCMHTGSAEGAAANAGVSGRTVWCVECFVSQQNLGQLRQVHSVALVLSALGLTI